MAAGRCFEDWLHHRGGTEPQEVRQGIEGIRAFVERHATSRFADWNDPSKQIHNRAGFRKVEGDTTTYYVFPHAFREACDRLDPTLVARALAKRRMLKTDTDDKFTRSERLPGLGNRRVHVLTPVLFGDQSDA